LALSAKVTTSIAILGLFAAMYMFSLTMSIEPSYRRFESPSWEHPLGTDHVGRDLMSYLLRASGTALLFGLAAPAISLGIGLLALFSTMSNRAEKIVTTLTDIFIAIPKYPLFIVLSFILPPRNEATLLVLSLLLWPLIFRIARPTFKQILSSGYVQAAIILGGGSLYIMMKYLVRKSGQLLIAQYSWNAVRSISMQTGLAFLGIGDVLTPSWGYMVRMAFDQPRVLYTGAWLWWILPPTACLAAMATAFILLAMRAEETRPRAVQASRLLNSFW
jgi:peptide/nickel transport system permease protein